ncbi:hypothetical protein COCNU_13G001320 [Cocos nucifera]|uniref:Uncharacterized protein n=1 Tax=Cocos nucifera TaxID=13894 RepID=A0A8K0IS58_COCNU|nr:hypothetical protein COCNU_13G001320 [Cocos nucifera]
MEKVMLSSSLAPLPSTLRHRLLEFLLHASSLHDSRPLSMKSIKALGDNLITDQHFMTRDYAEAVFGFDIGASNIAFVFLEDLLIQFRKLANRESAQCSRKRNQDLIVELQEKLTKSQLESQKHKEETEVWTAQVHLHPLSQSQEMPQKKATIRRSTASAVRSEPNPSTPAPLSILQSSPSSTAMIDPEQFNPLMQWVQGLTEMVQAIRQPPMVTPSENLPSGYRKSIPRKSIWANMPIFPGKKKIESKESVFGSWFSSGGDLLYL